MNTTTTTQANINIKTMRKELAIYDSENFPLEDLCDLFLYGIKGYEELPDDEIIETYNRIFNDHELD